MNTPHSDRKKANPDRLPGEQEIWNMRNHDISMKRIVAILLTLALVFSSVPQTLMLRITAYAEEEGAVIPTDASSGGVSSPTDLPESVNPAEADHAGADGGQPGFRSCGVRL